LQVVLRMAGVDGRTFAVPWLDGQRFRLVLAEG
jgi:hypothetical protein